MKACYLKACISEQFLDMRGTHEIVLVPAWVDKYFGYLRGRELLLTAGSSWSARESGGWLGYFF